MKKRDDALDFLRVLAMLFVVMIHYSNYYCRYLESINGMDFAVSMIFNGLARVSVPLFFMLSGALMLASKPDVQKLKKKILRFLLVLGVWTVFYFIWDILYMKKEFKAADVIGWLFEPTKPHLWFMYAIIAIYLILPFAYILVKHMGEWEQKLFIALWLFFCGGGYLLQTILKILGVSTKLNYSIPMVQGTYYLGYFVVGNILYCWLKEEADVLKKISSKLLWLMYGGTTIVTIVSSYLLSRKKGVYYDALFAYRNILVQIAAMSLFILAIRYVRVENDNLKKFLGKLSPCLFGVYLIHILFYNILLTNVPLTEIPAIYGIPLETIGTFVISAVVIYVFKKIPVIRDLV